MPSDFLISTVPYLGIIVVSDLGLVYAAYLSLSVWRGLSVPIYRSRALWTGILALLIGVATPISGNVSVLFPSSNFYFAAILVYFTLYPGVIFGLFVWIDRTITTLIRMDYLRRDLARWSKLRLVYWTLVGVMFATYFIGFFFYPEGPPILTDIFLVFLLLPAAYGSLALVIGSRRTTDITFRHHAKWLGFAIGALILISLISVLTTNIVLQSAPFLLISYCFYKVARFLVPVGKFQAD